jgi:hypothetical protein
MCGQDDCLTTGLLENDMLAIKLAASKDSFGCYFTLLKFLDFKLERFGLVLRAKFGHCFDSDGRP